MDTSKLSDLALSDSGFVFDPATGNTFTTNLLGMEIIKLLKSGLSEEEVKLKITEDYEVTADESNLDVHEFLDTLKKFYLIHD